MASRLPRRSRIRLYLDALLPQEHGQPAHRHGGYKVVAARNRIGETEHPVAFESPRESQHRIAADVLADFALRERPKSNLGNFDGREHSPRIRTDHGERRHEPKRTAGKLMEELRRLLIVARLLKNPS